MCPAAQEDIIKWTDTTGRIVNSESIDSIVIGDMNH